MNQNRETRNRPDNYRTMAQWQFNGVKLSFQQKEVEQVKFQMQKTKQKKKTHK